MQANPTPEEFDGSTGKHGSDLPESLDTQSPLYAENSPAKKYADVLQRRVHVAAELSRRLNLATSSGQWDKVSSLIVAINRFSSPIQDDLINTFFLEAHSNTAQASSVSLKRCIFDLAINAKWDGFRAALKILKRHSDQFDSETLEEITNWASPISGLNLMHMVLLYDGPRDTLATLLEMGSNPNEIVAPSSIGGDRPWEGASAFEIAISLPRLWAITLFLDSGFSPLVRTAPVTRPTARALGDARQWSPEDIDSIVPRLPGAAKSLWINSWKNVDFATITRLSQAGFSESSLSPAERVTFVEAAADGLCGLAKLREYDDALCFYSLKNLCERGYLNSETLASILTCPAGDNGESYFKRLLVGVHTPSKMIGEILALVNVDALDVIPYLTSKLLTQARDSSQSNEVVQATIDKLLVASEVLRSEGITAHLKAIDSESNNNPRVNSIDELLLILAERRMVANPGCMDLLTNIGVDWNAFDQHGQNAIHLVLPRWRRKLPTSISDALSLYITESLAIDQPRNKRQPLPDSERAKARDCIGKLVEAGTNINAPDKRGHSPIAKVMGDRALVASLYDLGARVIPEAPTREYSIIDSGKEKFISEKELTLIISDLLSSDSGWGFYDLPELATPHHLYLWAVAKRQAHVNSATTYNPNAFTELLPHLMASYRLKDVAPIANASESASDQAQSDFAGFERRTNKFAHRFEAELMMLLNHSDDSPDRGQIGSLTLALTSFGNFIRSKPPIKADGAIVTNWAAAGRHTFSFRNFRFDSMRIPVSFRNGEAVEYLPSLLEAFGAKYIGAGAVGARGPIESEVRNPFGSGFVVRADQMTSQFKVFHPFGGYSFRPFGNQTALILRQGCYSIYTENGILVIRNSSTKFGRNLLRHACYWAPKGSTIFGKSRKENLLRLVNFTPSQIEKYFVPIVSASLYTRDWGQAANINYAFEEWAGFRDCYRRFKFNTDEDAFETRNGVVDLSKIGGYKSPGFTPVVNMLTNLWNLHKHKGGALPDLVGVHPDMPPIEGYSFQDRDGFSSSRLPLSQELIETLNKLVAGKATDFDLERSHLRAFFQQVLFNKRSELTFLAGD